MTKRAKQIIASLVFLSVLVPCWRVDSSVLVFRFIWDSPQLERVSGRPDFFIGSTSRVAFDVMALIWVGILSGGYLVHSLRSPKTTQ